MINVRLIILSTFTTCLLALSYCSAATLNVTNYGAIPDCIQFHATIVSNSTTVTLTNMLDSSAIGKVLEIFGGGQLGAPAAGSTITNQDLAVFVTAVDGTGTNITISSVAGASSKVLCTFGTNNAAAFTAAVSAATNGDTIVIPSGNYLLLPSQVLDTNFVMSNYGDAYPSVYVSKGGLTFQGAGTNATILTGCGAWQNKSLYGTRGFILWLKGPATNDGPMVIDGMTFDGGVTNGRTGYDYFPVRVSDGDGWDVTHGAILDIGPPPLQQMVTIQNCSFKHWRGEILKSVVPNADGFRYITNCSFYDGNASANNFSFSHRISNCRFDTLKTAQEFYQGYSTQPSVFENSYITNIAGITGGGDGIVIGGPEVGHVQPSYTISNNIISAATSGLFLDPVQNLNVLNNKLYDSTIGVFFGVSGYQGSTNTGNVWIQGNALTNVYIGILMYGSLGREEPHDITVVGNLMQYPGANSQFAAGVGWSTNVYFKSNIVSGVTFAMYGQGLSGQWFIDDASNIFPFFSTIGSVGASNIMSYSRGMRQKAEPTATGFSYYLDDSLPLKIPPGAILQVTNSQFAATLYTSLSSVPPISIPVGYQGTFIWRNGAWNAPGYKTVGNTTIGKGSF